MRDDEIEAKVVMLVRAVMRQQHVSQLELAHRCGISAKTMSNRMLGRSRFTIVDLYAVGTALNVHPRVFLP